MKKQIVINASKDRSRIAIVEDGELAELYVENPDNVRTIGNIYLGRIQKVMPAIRAAFVDVGQKQDCFLHFSDLTDNFPQLLAMAGEEVPGLEEPVLSLAPSKRVADDEMEPDVEEKLEVEPADEESTSRRSRGRRARGRGRGRGRGRSEEEEEQEERKTKPLPSVIDLSSGPRRRPTRAPKDEPTASDEADADAEEPSDAASVPPETVAEVETDAPAEEAPRSRRSRRSKQDKQDAAPKAADVPEPTTDEAAEAEPSDSADAEASTDAETSDDKPKRKRRRRRGGRGRSRRSDDASEETDASDETSEVDAKTTASTEAAPEEAAPEEASAKEPPAESVVSVSPTGRSQKRLPASIDLTGSAKPERTRQTRADKDSETAGPDAEKASGRRSRRTRKPEGEAETPSSKGAAPASTEATEAETPKAADDEPGRSRRGRSRRAEDAESAGDTAAPSSSGSRTSRRRGGAQETPEERPAGRSAAKRPSGVRQSIPPSDQLLKRDGRILVKITKEPISTKGPRVSTDLSLAGRFLVLVPAADYVAVSKKIESAKERRRLRTLATSLKPDGFGVIVRTVAEGRDAKSLDTDLRLLVEKWQKIEKKLSEKPEPPVLLYEDVNMVSSIIRDLFSEDYDRILVDDPKVFRNVQAYVKAVAPQMADKVELHKGHTPVYRSVGIEKQVEEAFSKRVNMRGGGYLYIETTEAMHVIDVNSGRAGRGKSQKENLIAVNVEAAKEVAKQLRLRDLGGIIVVDFIDLKYDRDRKRVTDALKEAFKKDRAVTKLLPMSDFGLVQITRQRLRPSITTQAADDNGGPLDPAEAAAAAGAGEIPQSARRAEPEPEPQDAGRDEAPDRAAPDRAALAPEDATPQALSGRLRGWLDHYRRTVDDRYKGRPIVVRVHPLFGAYLRRGFPSPLTRWRLAMRGISFHLEEDPGTDPLGFDVRDQKSGRSLLKKYVA